MSSSANDEGQWAFCACLVAVWEDEKELSEWEHMKEARRKTSVAALVQQARRGALSEFEVAVEKHTRTYHVRGEGLQRFLQMTNWE